MYSDMDVQGYGGMGLMRYNGSIKEIFGYESMEIWRYRDIGVLRF